MRLTIRAASTTVAPHAKVVLSGRARMKPVKRAWRAAARQKVLVWARGPGQRRFRVVAHGRTDAAGRYRVSLRVTGATGLERVFASVAGARTPTLVIVIRFPASKRAKGGPNPPPPPPSPPPPPPPPPPSPAPGPGVAAFTRFAYLDQTTPADAAKYQFMALGYGTSSNSQAAVKQLIASIHASDPHVKILLYKTIYIGASDTQGIGSCTTWNPSLPYGGVPSSWFLKNSSGTPLFNSTYKTYWLDPGNPQVQQACLSSALTMAKSSGYDGVFWDMMSTSLFWAGLSGAGCVNASCASDASWQAAMESYIRTMTAALHAKGLLAIGNVSGGAVTIAGNGGPAIWQAYLQNGLDGAEEESFTSGTNHLPVPLAQWQQEVANEAWNEAHGKYLLANADVTSSQALNTYGLATMLLAAQGLSSWNVSSGNPNSGEYWFPTYDTALKLGSPRGAYSVLSDGLYVRQFQNGTVVVNPTAAAIADPMYGTVGANSALIL